jgi:hypothetical protein
MENAKIVIASGEYDLRYPKISGNMPWARITNCKRRNTGTLSYNKEEQGQITSTRLS